jgi:hypothetical protein
MPVREVGCRGAIVAQWGTTMTADKILRFELEAAARRLGCWPSNEGERYSWSVHDWQFYPMRDVFQVSVDRLSKGDLVVRVIEVPYREVFRGCDDA